MKFTGLVFLALPLAASAAAVTLTPSVASPAPLGTVVTFQANISDGAPYLIDSGPAG